MRFSLIISFLLFNSLYNLIDTACPDESWIPFSTEKCVKFLFTEFVTHDEAKKICFDQNSNAELIRIHSAAEQEFVTKLIFDEDEIVENVWLGAVRQKNSETEFVWEDPLQPDIVYANWADGSPSNDFKQNCTQLTSGVSFKSNGVQDGVDGLWTDVSCLKRNMVLCQKIQEWTLEDLQKLLLQTRSELMELQVNHNNLKEEHDQLQAQFDGLPDSIWPRSCQELGSSGQHINQIYPLGRNHPISVRCDFETDRGGWTVIQARNSGPLTQFNLDWSSYEQGFGSVEENYWIGLQVIHAITSGSTSRSELRVELEDWEEKSAFANYKLFSIGNSSDSYRLTIGDYEGDAGDSLGWHDGMQFSTYDQDNDATEESNCAEMKHGGWWFNRCSESNLNGFYFNNGSSPHYDGIHWITWGGLESSLRRVEMKIRDATE